MNFQTTAPLNSAAPSFRKTPTNGPESNPNPVYVRSAGTTPPPESITRSHARSLATDGAGAPSHLTARSLGDLKDRCEQAADSLEYRLKPGAAIDLGRLAKARVPGYLCRMTAAGDGYVVQTHEQARSAPSNGLFFPASNNPQGAITMDGKPVTDVNQLPPKMYDSLYAVARFVPKQPVEHLLMNT